jgi:hypothetical protein
MIACWFLVVAFILAAIIWPALTRGGGFSGIGARVHRSSDAGGRGEL